MRLDTDEIVRVVLEALGTSELARVKQRIGSKTLRSALRLIVTESVARADLFIPHYWAIYYHDGHGVLNPKTARKLVFFDDPKDDPRLNGGVSPERAADVRRLTRRQYEEGLRRNRERHARGGRPFMYVVDRVGPQAGQPFFDNLAVGAAKRADDIVARAFEKEFLRQIDRDPATKKEQKDATFDI